jgi:hypothetical protein
MANARFSARATRCKRSSGWVSPPGDMLLLRSTAVGPRSVTQQFGAASGANYIADPKIL